MTLRHLVSLIFLISAAPLRADDLPDMTRGVTDVLDQVYVLKTAADATAPKAVYGSCFVLSEGGLLATNYHVVSMVLHEPDQYNLYFVDGDQPLPAEVVAFDAVSDLALVHVNKVFPKAVRLATKRPSAGAKIFSIGWPADLNKSVIEGNYNGPMTAGPYHRLQMSIPLNPGMSGGPTLNEAGEVIGVNVSIRSESQSLAFAVPKELIEELMRRPQHTFSRAPDTGEFDEEMRRQLDGLQDRLADLVLKAPQALVEIGGWQADKPSAMVKCWREQENAPRDVSTTTTEHCYLPGGVPLRHDVETGTFHIKYQSVEGAKLSRWQFVHYVNDAVQGFPFSYADYIEKQTTRFQCGEMDFVNIRKVPLRAHYCVNALVHYPEIYNMELDAVTLTPDKSALLVGASLLGFSSRNLSEVTRALLNSIRPEPP